MVLPEARMSTTLADYRPMRSVRLARFDGIMMYHLLLPATGIAVPVSAPRYTTCP
jgi:hypothetical protein